MRIKLKDLFGFADQEKITYGLGYTLTLKRNTNNDAILRSVGVDAAKVVIKDIGWYIHTMFHHWKTNNLSWTKF